MQFYRCKCGKSTAWSSMGVSACSTCKHCKSDLAMGPESHREPSPHEYIKKYDEDTGEPYEICRMCLRKRLKLEAPPEPEAPPPPLPDPYLGLVKQYPHCDQYVLHAPGTCWYCDLPGNAPLHEYRRVNGINYTGESDPEKKKCPAEQRRGVEKIHHWHGNQPKSK